MAATPQGQSLTEQHRQAQQQVRAQFLLEFIALWQLLDSSRLDDTSPGWVSAVVRAISYWRLRSARVATQYYVEFRGVELPAVAGPQIHLPPGVTRPDRRPAPPSPPTPPSRPSPTLQPARRPEPPAANRRQAARSEPRRDRSTTRPTPDVIPEPRNSRVTFNFDDTTLDRPRRGIVVNVPDIDWDPSDRAAVVSMNVTGPASQKSKARRGKPLEKARDESFVEASGAATRHVLTGGRQSLLTLLGDDAQALGWARVTDGDPCAFCALLASRGPVYKTRQSAAFEAHDSCACTPEPVYSRDAPWPGHAADYRRLYRQSTRGTSGKDAINAFRRAYEQRQRDARRSDVA